MLLLNFSDTKEVFIIIFSGVYKKSHPQSEWQGMVTEMKSSN